jgi:hypothetical protein
MTSFDPMAVAVDWLDAYRAASFSIVDLYANEAMLECKCGGRTTLAGQRALIEYWRQRFAETPAGELEDLQPDGAAILIGYRVSDGIVQARLYFDEGGKIMRSYCEPIAEFIALHAS